MMNFYAFYTVRGMILCAGLCLAGTGGIDLAMAEAFEPPILLVENREGPVAPFSLYGRLQLAGTAEPSTGVLVWTEKRFGTNPFEIGLFAKRLGGGGWGSDHYLATLSEQPLPDGAGLWLENARRLHLVYATRGSEGSLLIHRVLDPALFDGTGIGGGTELVIDGHPGLLEGPVAAGGPRGAVFCYRRGSGLAVLEGVPGAKPLVIAADLRPVGFHLAAVGASLFVAAAYILPETLRDGLSTRIDLFEIRDGRLKERSTLAESPAPCSGLVMASSAAGRLAVAWSDDRHSIPELVNSEIYARQREPDGTWLREKRLTRLLGESLEPALLWDGDERLHLFWQDDREGTYEIYHRTADHADIDRVSNRDGLPSFTPRAALVAGRLTVVWRDTAEGRADIYVSRMQQGGREEQR